MEASDKKGCNRMISPCANSKPFVYHCVENHWGNQTFEICAPLINIIGKFIQANFIYFSTKMYKCTKYAKYRRKVFLSINIFKVKLSFNGKCLIHRAFLSGIQPRRRHYTGTFEQILQWLTIFTIMSIQVQVQ